MQTKTTVRLITLLSVLSLVSTNANDHFVEHNSELFPVYESNGTDEIFTKEPVRYSEVPTNFDEVIKDEIKVEKIKVIEKLTDGVNLSL